MAIEANLGPLALRADFSFVERIVRVLAEESLLTVNKARPAKLNGHPGVLKMGGGAWCKIVFLPDDGRYLGRCFLDHASEEAAKAEFETLCQLLAP
jgi:hypothetical protein